MPSNPTPTGIVGTEPWSSGQSKGKPGPPAALPAGRWPRAAGPQAGCTGSAQDRLRTARIRQSFSKPSPSSWSCRNPGSPANPAAGLGAPGASHVLLLPKGEGRKRGGFLVQPGAKSSHPGGFGTTLAVRYSGHQEIAPYVILPTLHLPPLHTGGFCSVRRGWSCPGCTVLLIYYYHNLMMMMMICLISF